MADIISEYEDKLPHKIIEEAKENVPKGISDTKLSKSQPRRSCRIDIS